MIISWTISFLDSSKYSICVELWTNPFESKRREAARRWCNNSSSRRKRLVITYYNSVVYGVYVMNWPIRCPTGVLNGFPNKNSMLREWWGHHKVVPDGRAVNATTGRCLHRSHTTNWSTSLRQYLKGKQPINRQRTSLHCHLVSTLPALNETIV